MYLHWVYNLRNLGWIYYLPNKTYQDRMSKFNTKVDKLAVYSMLLLFETLILFPLLLDITLSFLVSQLHGQRMKSFCLILAASDSQLKEITKTKSHTIHRRQVIFEQNPNRLLVYFKYVETWLGIFTFILVQSGISALGFLVSSLYCLEFLIPSARQPKRCRV